MLLRLSIDNIALIEHLELEFDEGLTVLTGETGAGKSIIVDSVAFVLGERAGKELIGVNAACARVEAMFDISSNDAVISLISELGVAEDNETVILSRDINAKGRSTCRINGTLTPLSSLKALGDVLLDIHGQHEHQSLFDSRSQLAMLDKFGDAEIAEAKHAVSGDYTRLLEIRKGLGQGFDSEELREQRMEILRYHISELDQARVKKGEDEALEKELRRLQNAERIMAALHSSYQSVYDNEEGDAALELIDSAAGELESISEFDEAYSSASEQLRNAYYTLEAAALDLRELMEGFEYDPSELAAVEDRLDLIRGLKRKFGKTLEAVIAYHKKAKAELSDLESGAETKERLKKERMEVEARLMESCKALSRARRETGERLAAALMAQFRDLGLAGAEFEVAFDEAEADEAGEIPFSANGLDSMEFMITPNPGQPLKPLSRIVSGGEASRIMLALKTIGSEVDGIGALIFDEIDTGISGRMAHVVAHKLIDIAEGRQVVCITHLPQIAAMADTHLLITKTGDTGATYVEVTKLSTSESIEEVARLSGAASDKAAGIKHAKSLKQDANAYKSQKSTG